MVRIAFIIDSLGIGGTEKSLVELINMLPEDQFDISVFALKADSSIVNQIERKVDFIFNILEIDAKGKINSVIKKKKFFKAIRIAWSILIIKVFQRLKISNSYYYKNTITHMLPVFTKQFDYAVFYSLPISIGAFYARMNIHAKRYYAWVHMDACAYPTKAIKSMRRIYSKYDKFFCVSNYCRESFLRLFPEFKNKTEVFYNILNYSKIRMLSKKKVDIPLQNNKIVIFSCARLSHEKRPVWAINIARSLKEQGLNFVWYWAGDGVEHQEIQEKIERERLNDFFIVLGNVDNPYPYYRLCDVYVQLSEHESYCLSLAEAAALSKRIVSTDFPTAYEITQNHPHCRLVHSQSKVVDAILELLQNNEIEETKSYYFEDEVARNIEKIF